MKFRRLIACLCLLIGMASLAAVAYLTWRNVVHGNGMILWVYLIFALAGVPLAITWWKDLVATEWPVVVSYVLAASLLASGFALYDGIMEHDNPWHPFAPKEDTLHHAAMTVDEFFKNMPPERPLWPRITAVLFLIFLCPTIVTLVYRGSLYALRSLRRRPPAAISQ